MSYQKKEFLRLNSEFQDSASNLLDSNTPTVSQLEYVLDTYNAIIVYSEVDYERKKRATKEFIEETINANRTTVQRCYEKLNIPVTLPGKLLSTIHYLPPRQPIHYKKVETKRVSTQTESKFISENIETQTDFHYFTETVDTQTEFEIANTDTQTDFVQSIRTISTQTVAAKRTNTTKMSQTVDSFLKTASGIINYKFNGDPLKLKGFINDSKLVEAVASTPETKALVITFLKSRLEAKAEESVPDDCDTVENLCKALQDKLKPDSSAIIEGKILALRMQKGNYSKFAEEAEKLGESLRRSLISEKLTKEKAEELTIRRMVELCRKTARNDVVKSVLESTKYETSKEVIATFITQSDKAKSEYKETQANNAKKSTNTNTYNKSNKNSYKNKDGNGSNKNSSYRANNRNQNGQSNKNGQNQQQNRGRYNKNRTEHTIRVVSGSQPSTSVEQPQQQPQEQFFRLED